MDLQLDGQVAIVTGASRGLGFEIACALVAEGANVVATARSDDQLADLKSVAPDQIATVVCDITDSDTVRGLVDVATRRFGRLDIVVNNAGIAPAGPFEDADQSLWDHTFAVNVKAPVTLIRAAAPVLLAQGRGKVVNIASITGLKGKRNLSSYSASKGALIRLTEALAAEWANRGVQVNAIAPGAFRTHAQSAVLSDPELLARRVKKIPARRIAEPSEIGPLACYLASPLADFVTGATFAIDGGEVNRL